MRFYTSYTNRRHKNYGAGILAGDPVHTRGWNVGVSVTAYDDRGRDSFVVRMTHGSHEGGLSTDLGTVRDTPDGPRWEPADSNGHRRQAAIRTALTEWYDGAGNYSTMPARAVIDEIWAVLNT